MTVVLEIQPLLPVSYSTRYQAAFFSETGRVLPILTKLSCMAFAFGCSRIFESAVITMICSLELDRGVVFGVGVLTVGFGVDFTIGLIVDFEVCFVVGFGAVLLVTLVFVFSVDLFVALFELPVLEVAVLSFFGVNFVLSDVLAVFDETVVFDAVFDVGFIVDLVTGFGVTLAVFSGDFLAFGVGVAFAFFFVWAMVSSLINPAAEKQIATTKTIIFRYNFFIFYLLLKVREFALS